MQDPGAATTTGIAAPERDPRRWITLAIMLIAVLIAGLDSTILNVAIPTILRDFHTTLPSLQWVITGYSLTFAALLIISGRLGDIFGARRMFIIGAALFATGSLIASISTGVPSLVLGEAIIEGMGASLMLPATMSIMSSTFTGHERATAFSAWGAVLGAAVAFGPLLGGFLTTNYSWRWAFRINVIVAPLAILGALFFVRRSPRGEKREKIDVPGALLIASGMFMLVFAISEGETYGWWTAKKSLDILGGTLWPASMPVSIAPVAFVLSACLLYSFYRLERYKERTDRSPLFAFSNLERPSFRFGTVTLLLMAMGQVSFLLVMSVVLQDGRDLSAITTGLWLVPSGLAIVFGSQFGNWLTRRIGTTNVVRAGLFLVATGLAACALALTPDIAFVALLPGFVILGIGIGFAGSQLNNVILSDVPPERAGAASGANTTVRMIGASLGIAVISAMLTTQSSRATIVSDAHAPLIFAAIVVYFACALSFRIPQVGPRGSRQAELSDDPDLELALLDVELTAQARFSPVRHAARMEMPTVTDAAQSIRSGGRSAEELTTACLDAIERDNPELNAFVYLDAAGALAAARAVDAAVRDGHGDQLGPLAGVPFGVKDLEDCAGMPTTEGSRWFANGPAKTSDSIHVGRLRAAGAIPVGKTASPEFGAWAYTASPLLGVTRNPWDPSRTPGGSSGGTAAAVSAGMIPFGTASDGGGSIRTPASFTGLVGLRATYGRIPSLASTHLAQNSVNGFLATTVADSALLLDVMAGPDARDRTCLDAPAGRYADALDADLSRCRVAWSSNLGFAIVDPDVSALCEDAARAFVAATGATLVDRPIELDDYIRIYTTIEGVDKFVGYDRDLWENHLDELDPLSAPGWKVLSQKTLPWEAAVEERRRKLVTEVAAIFDDVDLILTPMSCMAPFAAEGPMPTEINGEKVHGGMSVVLAMLANLVNLPAVSVPAGLVAGGLPVGLQIIGPRFREDLVLAAAAQYEAARPWPRQCTRA